jgi:hypothetical protein
VATPWVAGPCWCNMHAAFGQSKCCTGLLMRVVTTVQRAGCARLATLEHHHSEHHHSEKGSTPTTGTSMKHMHTFPHPYHPRCPPMSCYQPQHSCPCPTCLWGHQECPNNAIPQLPQEPTAFLHSHTHYTNSTAPALPQSTPEKQHTAPTLTCNLCQKDEHRSCQNSGPHPLPHTNTPKENQPSAPTTPHLPLKPPACP